MRKMTHLSLLLVLLATSSIALGQSNYASVSGTVFDPQQKAIAGASVQITSDSTGRFHGRPRLTIREYFQVNGLLPGQYKFSVHAPGFAALTQNLTLEVGQQMTLDVTLKLLSVSSTVDVNTDTINVLRTTDASVGALSNRPPFKTCRSTAGC